jgi:hypothetical protein
MNHIGSQRARLRQATPATANSVLLFLDPADPDVYFTRLQDLHIERRRLGYQELLDEISGQLLAQTVVNVPVQT